MVAHFLIPNRKGDVFMSKLVSIAKVRSELVAEVIRAQDRVSTIIDMLSAATAEWEDARRLAGFEVVRPVGGKDSKSTKAANRAKSALRKRKRRPSRSRPKREWV
jgi:hypothetical protein